MDDCRVEVCQCIESPGEVSLEFVDRHRPCGPRDTDRLNIGEPVSELFPVWVFEKQDRFDAVFVERIERIGRTGEIVGVEA